MSADRWIECPVCRVNHENYLKKQHESVKRAYGTMPPEEWIKLRDNLLELEEKESRETLAEYYEFYLDEKGNLSVHYNCRCIECGTDSKFSHDVESFIELPEKYK